MAFISGHTGDITVGGTAVKVKSWTSNLTQEEIENTRKGDQGWRTFSTGLKHIEGSFECDMDTAIHATGTFPFPFATAAAAIVLSMNDGTNNGGDFSFNGYVFNCEFSSPVEGQITISGNFKSSGVVTYNAAA